MTDLSVWSDEETRPRRSRRRRKKTGRGKTALAVVLSLLLVVGVIGGVAALAFGGVSKIKDVFSSSSAPDYPGPGEGTVVIEVKTGDTSADVAQTLKAEDVVKSTQAFVTAAYADPDASHLQPGFYQVQHKMAAADALAAVLDPSARIQARVTLPEGLRLDETLHQLAKDTELPLKDYEKALTKRAAALGLPDYAQDNPEGFLYPATYDVEPNATADSVLTQLFSAYQTAADRAGVARTNRSPEDIVVIASLVEAEARNAEDFGKVARVVYNRLAKNMPLQFDSTVNYALKADKEIVTYEDLGADSPYNTYKNQGLPPAPINSPGLAALTAAVNPTPGDWLYFVTTDPSKGTTKFTGDYQEFLRFKGELKSNQ
ncbi:MAG: endolytic transglycosylase MltG [Sporichthyaceae bacterium]